MQNEKLIRDFLHTYTEDEIFYRDYYYAKKAEKEKPEVLARFLQQFDPADIIARRLLCPELNPEARIFLSEHPEALETYLSRDVEVVKHNRYSPLFNHYHSYFEIFYVLEGSCLHYIDHTCTCLKKGTLCFISPDTTHAIEVTDDSIVLNIQIRKSTFADIFFNMLRSRNVLSDFFISNLYGTSQRRFLFFNANDKELEDLILTMVLEEIHEDEYTSRILGNYLSIFCTQLVRKYGRNAEVVNTLQSSNEIMTGILSYLNDNYRTVTLTDVADHFGYTVEHTSRLIKAETGQTFTDFLRSVRIKRAEVMLLNTPWSVEKIGTDVGYETSTSFIKYFKQIHSMTPTQFRKANKLQ